MNAVDLFDASLHLNYNIHRNKKWTQAFLYVLLKMATTNAWIYYCAITKKKITNIEFIKQLLKEGINQYETKQKKKKNT